MGANVKTGKVTGRRDLSFETLDDVLADLDRLEEAHAAGTLKMLGNWSAGQIFEHTATLFDFSVDGFSFKAPLFIRLMSPILKNKLFGPMPIPAGLQLRGGSAVMIPDDVVTFEDGLTHLRRSIGRITAGERMTQPSPVFGRMTHGQWVTLHLKHCALHLSFLVPG